MALCVAKRTQGRERSGGLLLTIGILDAQRGPVTVLESHLLGKPYFFCDFFNQPNHLQRSVPALVTNSCATATSCTLTAPSPASPQQFQAQRKASSFVKVPSVESQSIPNHSSLPTTTSRMANTSSRTQTSPQLPLIFIFTKQTKMLFKGIAA